MRPEKLEYFSFSQLEKVQRGKELSLFCVSFLIGKLRCSCVNQFSGVECERGT